MDREISKDLFEVEDPVYMDYDEMKKKYYDYVVVVTDTKKGDYGTSVGGIARCYTAKSKDIYDKFGEYANSRKYGDCTIRVFKSKRGLLGGLFL